MKQPYPRRHDFRVCKRLSWGSVTFAALLACSRSGAGTGRTPARPDAPREVSSRSTGPIICKPGPRTAEPARLAGARRCNDAYTARLDDTGRPNLSGGIRGKRLLPPTTLWQLPTGNWQLPTGPVTARPRIARRWSVGSRSGRPAPRAGSAARPSGSPSVAPAPPTARPAASPPPPPGAPP